MDATQTKPAPDQAPQPRRVKVTLSYSAGGLLIACIDQIYLLPNGPDGITVNILSAVRNEIETKLGYGTGLTPKQVFSFNWSEPAYILVFEIVAMAHRLDPKNADSNFREALLKVLLDAYPVTRARDCNDAAQAATQGARIVDLDVPPHLMSSSQAP